MTRKVIYLDENRTLTADDLHSVDDCDRWIRVIDDQTRRIRARRDDPRSPGALYYRRRALHAVKVRRSQLI